MINKKLFKEFKPWAEQIYALLFFLTLIAAAFLRWPYITIERMWPDEALYAWHAQRIFNHPALLFSKEIIEFHPPLFSCLLALGHFFFPPEVACRVVCIILNLAGIAAIYVLGSRISSRFLGLFGAVTLAFNYNYLENATHILIDSGITVCSIFLILALLSVHANNLRRNDIFVGILGSAMILLKWSGVVVIPFLIVYYLLIFSDVTLKRRVKKALIPLSVILVLVILLLLNNLIQLGHFFPDTSALKGFHNRPPFWYYVFNFHNILMLPLIMPFFVYGLVIIFNKKDKKQKLLFTWFLIFLTAISLVPEKTLRYGLLILPSSLLIAGLGLEETLKKFFQNSRKIKIAEIICIFGILLSFWHLYPRTKAFLEKSAKWHSGFKEGGEWVKEHAAPDTLIMAGSRRTMRYYSGINFQEFGGRIMAIPASQREFKEIISSAQKPIILEIDYWEYTQPQWVHPFSEEKMQYLNELGFSLVQVVEKERTTPTGERKIVPVLWLFKKELD